MNMQFKLVTGFDKKIGKKDFKKAINKARGTNPHIFSEEQRKTYWEGWNARIWQFMGHHVTTLEGVPGTYICIYSPHTYKTFIEINGERHEMSLMPGSSNIYELFLPNVTSGSYDCVFQKNNQEYHKVDPVSFSIKDQCRTEITKPRKFKWKDGDWIKKDRVKTADTHHPVNILEVYLPQLVSNKKGKRLKPEQAAKNIVDHMKKLKFNTLEIMPVSEYPNDDSMGYHILNYFAITRRVGAETLKCIVNECHQAGFRVILDYPVAHYKPEPQGLANMEYGDAPTQWDSNFFNCASNEVRSFLLSFADYFISEFHIDGFRLDAVSDMVFYNPKKQDEGERPGAVRLLHDLNTYLKDNYPGVTTASEESYLYSQSTNRDFHNPRALCNNKRWAVGEAFFFFKKFMLRNWNRRELAGEFEKVINRYKPSFLLPLSHDDTLKANYGGDPDHWGTVYQVLLGGGDTGNKDLDHIVRVQRLALLLASMYGLPVDKLLYMAAGLTKPWHPADSFSLTDGLNDPQSYNSQLFRFIQALNNLYLTQPAMYELSHHGGFELLNIDKNNMAVSFFRKARELKNMMLVVIKYGQDINADKDPAFDLKGYHVPVWKIKGARGWQRLLQTNDPKYFTGVFGDKNIHLLDKVYYTGKARGGKNDSVLIPHLHSGAYFFKYVGEEDPKKGKPSLATG
ncbi:alpha-amylase family glycosyl hydrolase [Candidatus Margulisiibacteriota bacterium]